jgi:alkylation response protein AidB-like acyl-CoA dehydrogenase
VAARAEGGPNGDSRAGAAGGETAGDILAAVRDLAPTIAARADEIEQGRRVPPDLVDQLRTAGCFRITVPRSHGGAGLDLITQLRVNEELARVDGSTAWIVMIGSGAPILLGLLPRATFDAVYAGGPDVIMAGVLNPSGVATPVEGGYQVTGQWSFASGCEHCDWAIAHCLVDDGRVPPVRMMVLPPDQIEVRDTWSVVGLAGTGSHDFAVDGAFVPDERTFVVGGEPALDIPLLRVPLPTLFALQNGSVAVGIAQGALDDVLDLAAGKVPAFDKGRLAENPLFQNQVAEADAALRAARALLYDQAATMWQTAVDGAPFTAGLRSNLRATATWTTRTAAAVVNTAYSAGGGTSIYRAHPLQRRLRDAHTVTQHFGVKPDTLTRAGAVLAGQDVDLTFF